MRAAGPGESALLLLDVIEVLDREAIAYAVIGAFAAAIHGVVRASLDADALLRLGTRRLKVLESTLAALGLRTQFREGDVADPIPAMLELGDAFGNRVDLLAGLRGLDIGAFDRACAVPFQGAQLRVIGREDFIAMKLFAGGPVDLADARRAIAFAAGDLDRPLLTRLANRFGPEAAARLESLLP